MRKSRVIAVVIASLVSSASFVQAQSVAPVATREHAEGRGGIRARHGAGGALKGITLSAAEKAKVKAIHAKYATEGKSLRASLKPAMQEARAARQKGDTVAARAVWERNKAGRDQVKALRNRQMADVRGALTAEHQTQFDANVAAAAQRRAEFVKDGGRKGLKGRHKGEHKGRRAGTTG